MADCDAPAVRAASIASRSSARAAARVLSAFLLLNAEAAARELGRLSLADALDFLLLLSEKDPARFDPAAARWHARFVLEARRLRLADSQLLLGAVAGLRSPAPVIPLDTIRALAEKAHLSAVVAVVRRRL